MENATIRVIDYLLKPLFLSLSRLPKLLLSTRIIRKNLGHLENLRVAK